MKRILPVCILIAILIYSCSRDTLISPKDNFKTSGKVELKIDKVNAPQNVVSVIAYLSRSGFSTLTAQLNLRSDTTADITFQNISVGTWHLVINAVDANGVVVYSGQSDVNVVDGMTTLVNLTLVPVTNGTGNIFITVSWGTSQSMFTDYSNNPVFTINGNPSNPNAVSEVKMIYDNGIYKMWYLCTYNAGRGNIWYAESPDGINWMNKSNGPVLDTDSLGSWDSHAIGGGSIIKDGNIYRMYFNGLSENYGQSSAGLAVSFDGINWQKYPYPVLWADSSAQYHIGTETVLKVNGTYYLYYGASPKNNYDAFTINLATSTDGINFTKYSGNPIISSTLPWEGIGVTYPSAIYDGNQFVMIYENSARDYEGIAYSNDGVHWTKKHDPVFSKYQTSKHWAQIDYPFFIKMGNEYRIYYSSGMGGYELSISFARSYNIY